MSQKNKERKKERKKAQYNRSGRSPRSTSRRPVYLRPFPFPLKGHISQMKHSCHSIIHIHNFFALKPKAFERGLHQREFLSVVPPPANINTSRLIQIVKFLRPSACQQQLFAQHVGSSSIQEVEYVVVALVTHLRDDSTLLQQVVNDGTGLDFGRACEPHLHVFSESGRIVVPDRLGVSESLQYLFFFYYYSYMWYVHGTSNQIDR